MRAGSMKYKLRLLQPVKSENAYGSEATSYEQTAVVWAERVKYKGSRSDEAGEHFADYRAEYYIRDAHDVRDGWRVEQLGGELYNVVAVEPNIDKGMKTLVCERVNE